MDLFDKIMVIFCCVFTFMCSAAYTQAQIEYRTQHCSAQLERKLK